MNKPNQIWQRAGKDLLDSLQSGPQGLTTKEAQQRLEKYGPNELQEGGKKSGFRIFLEQFADFLVIILIVAAVISAVLGDVESMVVILAVITMNAILGTVQTIKAEASLDSLKQMSAPTAKVVRDGKTIQIPGRDVVPGDIVVLEAGDAVCADGRLLESASLKTAESALTGESLPVEKEETPIEAEDVPLGDRKNMVFSGTFVTYGRGRFLVTGTGMETEMGKIASLLKTTSEKKTPLQVSLDNFGKKLSIGILVLCAILFAVSVLVRGENVMSAFLFAVALAAIPEALSSIVTIVLSFGTRKMAKEHAIIRKLQAVEGLGSVSVICSDKTGTLTQNKMTVRQLYVGGRVIPAAQADFKDPIQEPLLRAALLCSDATVNEQGEIGDPTETAIAQAAAQAGLEKATLERDMPRRGEAPFDSVRKRMATCHALPNGEALVAVKGAPEAVLARCTHLLGAQGPRPLTDGDRRRIAQVGGDLAGQALRVLAVAQRLQPALPKSMAAEGLEAELTFVGLIGMMDPPRPEVRQAVDRCAGAGIRPVMITGDHKDTAVAIAKQLNIYRPGDKAIDGAGLDFLPQETLEEEIEAFSVYARVTPEHKMRIVQAWQRRGHVVAMTGDGVNDAPALKAADIGCAMGKTGTDVAKGAADMILTDDNFATVVAAVEQGRGIYANIRKAIHYLLSCNIGEILTIFLATLLPVSQAPLSPVQLLWLNLVTDSLPALALGMEPVEKTAMTQPPRGKEEPLFSRAFSRRLAWQGALVGGITLLAYGLGFHLTGTFAVANTMAFATLTFSQLFHAFDVRSETTPLFRLGVLSNKAMNKAFLAGAALQAAVLLAPPLQGAFSVVPLALEQWGMVLGLALTPLVVCEAAKLLRPKGRKKSPAGAAQGARETVGTR